FAGLVGEIEQDGAGFEDADRCAAIGWFLIDDGGHAVVGGNLQEIRLELIAGADIDGNQSIGEVGFLQKHGDLVAVRRRPIIEVDHAASSFAFMKTGMSYPGVSALCRSECDGWRGAATPVAQSCRD